MFESYDQPTSINDTIVDRITYVRFGDMKVGMVAAMMGFEFRGYRSGARVTDVQRNGPDFTITYDDGTTNIGAWDSITATIRRGVRRD